MADSPYKLPLRKRILKHPLTLKAVALLASLYIRFLRLSCRTTIECEESARPYMRGEKPCIFVIWHGRLLAGVFHPKMQQRHIKTLISEHQDGKIIANILGFLGYATIHGSSSKGGSAAVRQILKATRTEQCSIAITPDGPRGPAQKAADGALWIAKATGYPVIPLGFSAARGKRFGSWDRFLLPHPFTKLVLSYGNPLYVAKEDSEINFEARRVMMESELNRLNNACDNGFSLASMLSHMPR